MYFTIRIKYFGCVILVSFQKHQKDSFLDFKLLLNYFINILTNKQASPYHTIRLLQNQFIIGRQDSLAIKLPSSYELHKLVIVGPFDRIPYNLQVDFEPFANLKTLGLEQI